jgi:hypothetical protein
MEAVTDIAERQAPRLGLDRPATRVPLIYALACGAEDQYTLATRYGVNQSSISRFAVRWEREIAVQAGALEDKLAALWIADKTIRIATLQDDADRIDTYLAEMEMLDPALLRVKHAALRAAAEEMGQLKTVIDTTVSVRYEVVGVDPEVLR